MNRVETYLRLGRFMLATAPKFVDHTNFNNWVRVGEMLVEVGLPFVTDPTEYSLEDQAIVLFAARVMGGKIDMPECHAVKETYRIQRSVRMSKALIKGDKSVVIAKRPLGRPRKNTI
jgi:hypothetical protein